MKQISELEKSLTPFLNWNKARVTCLVQILQGLFRTRTVNLARIAQSCDAFAKEESTYRKFQRFFKNFSFDMTFVVVIVLHLFAIDGQFILIMDRTNWKWGEREINILMLSIEFFGIGIPLFWVLLDKKGTSSTSERISILQKVFERLGYERIGVLLADREFIGEDWFSFLIRAKIPFIIRVKKNFMVEGLRDTHLVPIKELLKKLGRKKYLLNYPIVLWGIPLYASVQFCKNAKEPMIVVSNIPFPNAIQMYRKRWSIETLFFCLKGRGFRLEDTHMTDARKLEKLLFILTIAFCWALKTGEIKSKEVKALIKTHGRKAKSTFRVGLDLICSLMIKGQRKIKQLIELLACFTCLRKGNYYL